LRNPEYLPNFFDYSGVSSATKSLNVNVVRAISGPKPQVQFFSFCFLRHWLDKGKLGDFGQIKFDRFTYLEMKSLTPRV
jgi:hypothetical protein